MGCGVSLGDCYSCGVEIQAAVSLPQVLVVQERCGVRKLYPFACTSILVQQTTMHTPWLTLNAEAD